MKRLFIISSLFLATALSGAIGAQVPIQATATRTLLNGLQVQILASPSYPRVALHLLIGAGTTLDPAGKAGLAELAAALLLESIPDWRGDPAEIGRIIEAGKTFRYEVGWDATHLYAECAPGELPIYFQALTRFIRNPVMSEKYFAPMRDRILARVLGMLATERTVGETLYDQELFRGNPYGRLISGTPDSIRSISYGETVLFQRRTHLPNVSVLTVVGNVNADQVKTLAGRNLGIWIMDDSFPFTFLPPPGATGLALTAVEWAAAAEPALIAGNLGVTRDSPDHMPLQMLLQILQLRAAEKQATVKTLFTTDGRRLRGALRFIFQAKELDGHRALSELRQMLTALRTEGPTEAETRRAAEICVGTLHEQVRTAAGMARLLAESETYRLGFSYYLQIEQEMTRMTPDELKRVAQKLFDPDKLLAVFVAPAGRLDADKVQKDGWQLRRVTLGN